MSARQGDVLEGADQRLFEFSRHALDDLVSPLPAHGGLVVAMFDQRREDVGDGQDANDVGNALGAETVRVSAAVEIFVMMQDGIENFRR
jgi:hypothetical protein